MLYQKSINVTFTELTPTTFELEAEETSDTSNNFGDKTRFRFDEEVRASCGNLIVESLNFTIVFFFGDDIHSLR
jgi:hypothetical protein